MAADHPALQVVLVQPEIAENTGNIGRTCLAAGAKLWLVRPLGFRIEDRRLRRSGMDYWRQLDWEAVDSWPSLAARLSTERMWFFSKSARRRHDAVVYRPGDVLVFGAESCGLPPSLLLAHADRCLRIPMRPHARSLNLAVAAGVAIYEAWRQLGFAGEIDDAPAAGKVE